MKQLMDIIRLLMENCQYRMKERRERPTYTFVSVLERLEE